MKDENILILFEQEIPFDELTEREKECYNAGFRNGMNNNSTPYVLFLIFVFIIGFVFAFINYDFFLHLNQQIKTP